MEGFKVVKPISSVFCGIWVIYRGRVRRIILAPVYWQRS